MLNKSVKIGDRVEIYQMRDKLDNKVYVSQVEDIVSENELLIHMPISFGQVIKLPLKNKYAMLFFTDEKGMIRFDTEIIEYRSETELNFMLIRLISEGEKIQRRAFYRFNCLLPLKFNLISEDAAELRDQYQAESGLDAHFEGVIKDIGGGGIRFVSNEDIDEGGRIRSIIMLNDDVLVAEGKVLNKQYFPKSNFKYQYRVEFWNATKDDQDRIVKYIFVEERKITKRMR